MGMFVNMLGREWDEMTWCLVFYDQISRFNPLVTLILNGAFISILISWFVGVDRELLLGCDIIDVNICSLSAVKFRFTRETQGN